jgi:hypothetical protein
VSGPNRGRIGEQHDSYRRGLVLGLTMAEVGILIIFVLLLLLAFQELRRDEITRAFRGKTPVDATRLAELTSLEQQFGGKLPVDATRLSQLNDAESTLHDVAEAMGVKVGDAPQDDFRRLAQVVAATARTNEGRSNLAEASSLLAEMRAATREAQNVAKESGHSSDGMSKRLATQSYRIANQEGQLARYESQLAASGQGKGERPCWVQPDGRIDYLYDVVLGSDGIRMSELPHPERAAERALLPMPITDKREALSETEFLRHTNAIYAYSTNAQCRFFVVVYDSTAAHEKPLYKNLLRAVEGHFYKRLSTSPPPF